MWSMTNTEFKNGSDLESEDDSESVFEADSDLGFKKTRI
jgi:hypothetical protein